MTHIVISPMRMALMGGAPVLLAFVLLALLTAESSQNPAMAADDDAPIVQERVARFKQSGADIQDIFKKYLAVGDATAIAQAAARMAEWGAVLPDYFPVGSSSAGARAEIWQNFPDFKAKAQQYAAAARQLQKIAEQGDMKGVAAQARIVGGTCKACHDSYRIKK